MERTRERETEIERTIERGRSRTDERTTERTNETTHETERETTRETTRDTTRDTTREITMTETGFKIKTQESLGEEALEVMGLGHGNPVKPPAIKSETKEKDETNIVPVQATEFRQAAGKLIFISGERDDHELAVEELSRSVSANRGGPEKS